MAKTLRLRRRYWVTSVTLAILLIAGAISLMAWQQHKSTQVVRRLTHKQVAAARHNASPADNAPQAPAVASSPAVKGASTDGSSSGSDDKPTPALPTTTENHIQDGKKTGRLTDVQVTALTKELQDIQTYANSIADKPQAEWVELMQRQVASWQSWCHDNNIPYSYIDQYLRTL